MKNNILVSVLMPVYNCSDTLSEAIDCIIAQTYTYWELVICDDGSADDTVSIVEKYIRKYPEKIKLIKNENNMGLNYTLNRCLKLAQGKYIARMDGDDLCSPDRLLIEIEELENNNDIAIISTDMEFFDESGVWGRISHPDYPEPKDFVKESPFCHAPCMVRKEAYDAVDGYTVDKKLLRVEDYHLWIKMYAAGFKGKNIHAALYQMRDNRNAYQRRTFASRLNESYVKRIAIKELHLPCWMIIYSLRPIVTGLMPKFVYDRFHRNRLSSKSTGELNNDT